MYWRLSDAALPDQIKSKNQTSQTQTRVRTESSLASEREREREREHAPSLGSCARSVPDEQEHNRCVAIHCRNVQWRLAVSVARSRCLRCHHLLEHIKVISSLLHLLWGSHEVVERSILGVISSQQVDSDCAKQNVAELHTQRKREIDWYAKERKKESEMAR